MNKKLILLCLVLVLALGMFSLPVAADDEYTITYSGVNAPESTLYYPGMSAPRLSLPSTVYAKGPNDSYQQYVSPSANPSQNTTQRTFQWYQLADADDTVGTAIEGATNAAYNPSTETEGTFYFYGEMQQTYRGYEINYKTGTCAVTIANEWPEEPEVIPYGMDVSEAEIKYFQGEEIGFSDALAAPSSYRFRLADGTLLSTATPQFQWYKKTDKDAATGTLIEGATSYRYTPSTAEVGTTYYYCVATGVGYDWTFVSKTATLTVLAPEIPDPTAENGFVESLALKSTYNGMALSEFQFDPEVTTYDITLLDTGNPAISVLAKQKYVNAHYFVNVRFNGLPCYDKSQTSLHSYPYEKNIQLSSVLNQMSFGETGVISVMLGKRGDSDGNGSVTYTDDFEALDAYQLNVTLKPGFSTLTLSDGEGTALPLTPAYDNNSMYCDQDFYAVTDGDTVKLNANFGFGKGVKVYIGDNATPFTAAISGETIDLTQYRNGGSVAVVPLKLVWGEGNEQVTNTYNLHIGPTNYLPTITKNLDTTAVTIDKDTTTTLKVEAEVEEGELAYQWMMSDVGSSITYMQPIDGATSATYDASPSHYAQSSVASYISTGTIWYACRVTNTVNGETFVVNSNITPVKCNQNYVSPPEILLQPGSGQYARTDIGYNGLVPFKTEYMAGEPVDPFNFYVKGTTGRIDPEGNGNDYYTEADAILTAELYMNDKPSVEGATLVETTRGTQVTSSAYLGFSLVSQESLTTGDWYFFAKVTATSFADPEMNASTYTDIVKVTVTTPEIELEGSGTKDDPYLLKTADDFDYVRHIVNDLDYSMTGLYLKMTDDITLNEGWESIGDDIKVPFSAILDGDGYTVSYQKGSKPLFEYTLDATIKNIGIYGEEIDGCGLINNYTDSRANHTVAFLDNVTLKSGTSTLKSGLAAGSYYSLMGIKVSNCVAEEGVVIGYDKSQSKIATFVSLLVGTVENCKSAATVYGVDNVGGIVAYGGNAMGLNSTRNCEFSGTIVASGKHVGGILGAGYSAESAPNGKCASINNCLVTGSVTGATQVGGIYGAEAGVEQCWNNGIGYIRNNLFYGTVEATDIDGVAGGVIGHMCSLNRYNIIENNYFLNTCGAEKGIGSVTHIDTSAVEFGTHDGVLYYDTSKDDLDRIKILVDGPDDQYRSVDNINHNRDDDPLGKDADKLAKPVTEAELTGETVVKALNDNEYSLHNWVKNDEGYPVLSDEAIALSLDVAGDFRTEFYIGEELDLSGIEFTVTWSDGSETHPTLDEVTVTGFDSSKRAALTLIASVNGVSAEIPVKVIIKPVSNEITVYFTLLGDDIHNADEDENYHLYETDTLTTWIERTQVTVDINATVLDVIDQVLTENGYTYKNDRGDYISAVTTPDDVTLAEFTNGTNSGWMYTLNKKHSQLSVIQQFLEDGDELVLHYTDDYKQEEKKEKAAEYVDSLIDKIGEVTLDSEEAINNAKEAYEKLSDEEKELVEKKDVLDAAEAKLAELKADASAAKAVDDAIAALPDVDEVSLDDEEAILAAKEAYDALTDDQKAYVANADKLDAVLEKLEELKNKPAENPFVDVTEKDYFYDAVLWAVAEDITKGTDATHFSPSGNCTRAQVATFLWRAAGMPEPESAVNPFSDVKADAYYYKAVLWAVENEITTGTGGGKFSPNGNCSRGQVATFLWRAAGSPEPTSAVNPFGDVKADDYFYKAVLWAVDQEITKGTDATHFSPAQVCTRGQVVTFLYRAK